MIQPADISLNDGRSIPQFGFGLWQVPVETAEAVVSTAIATGFRSIDTAEAYFNETETGAAIRKSGLHRDAFFVTTKVWNEHHGRDATLRAFDASLKRLGLDTIDLYLMHWPSQARNLYVETWRALIELKAQGRVRSIGVSNFAIPHLNRIIDRTGVVPAVNQIELHPRFQQRALREFHLRHDIVTESWSPLGLWKSSTPAIDDPAIRAIATKHRCSPAQVILRWHLQSGLAPLTRSVRPARIEENFASLNVALDESDMRRIADMDRPEGRLGPDPETATF